MTRGRRSVKERVREGAGRVAGSDGGWGVLISSQLFIPVSLHRGEKKRERESKGGREREMQGEEGREEGRLLPLLLQCTAAPR